jgi:predicted rRNA methylase YqxC with S4 and FtsJ domains
VRDPAAVEAAAAAFSDWCAEQGLSILGRAPSVLPGAEGNRELFFHLRVA